MQNRADACFQCVLFMLHISAVHYNIHILLHHGQSNIKVSRFCHKAQLAAVGALGANRLQKSLDIMN